MSSSPKLIIHIGPGKTGSSVIQEWLASNRTLLLKNGYYYPEHPVDANGISSGNFKSIFTGSDSKRYEFDPVKADNLLKEATEKGAKYLLLSSEAFAARCEPITEFFDDANFIFYLRNPMESSESLYNQSVKRHFNTSVIKVPESVNFGKLKKLNRACATQNHELTIRFYGSDFFQGGNIVQDFLFAIGMSSTHVETAKLINRSYSLQALEFKRILNQFPLQEMHKKLDIFLQQFEYGTMTFSVYSNEQFAAFKRLTLSELNGLFKELNVNGDKFLAYIESKKQKETHEQTLRDKDALVILKAINEYSPALFYKIKQVVTTKKLSFINFEPLTSEVLTKVNEKKRLKEKLLKLSSFLSISVNKEPTNPPLEQRHIEALMKTFKVRKHMDEGLFLRELAIYLESQGDILQAFKHMAKAKEFRPHGDIINRKLIEYAKHICQTSF